MVKCDCVLEYFGGVLCVFCVLVVRRVIEWGCVFEYVWEVGDLCDILVVYWLIVGNGVSEYMVGVFYVWGVLGVDVLIE